MANPIWKDKLITVNYDGGLYRIIEGSTNDVIFTGRAFLQPGGATIDVVVNDPIADYIAGRTHFLPTINQATFTPNGIPFEFVFEEYLEFSQTWDELDRAEFDDNWSYDYGYVQGVSQSFPIDGRIDARQPILYSAYEQTSIVAQRYFKNGTSSNVTCSIGLTPLSGTGCFLPASWTNLDRVVIGSNTYKVVTDCAKYALYYINPYGGWDSYLIRGEAKEVDNLTRHDRKMVYVNKKIENRGEDNYLTEVDKTFTLNSGALTDDEASRMPYLLNSTYVFLYDFSLGEFLPVVITDSVTEYKTYKNEGRRLINYVITVKLAQDRKVR